MRKAPDKYFWPPECCVPAFLYSALWLRGVEYDKPERLPQILGVKVRKDQANPLNLEIAATHEPTGVASKAVESQINEFLKEAKSGFVFRRMPFSTIIFGMWYEYLIAAQRTEIIVGVGVDYKTITGAVSSDVAQHVFRIIKVDKEIIDLFDDSKESVPVKFSVHTDGLARAVNKISDGFWMIGTESEIGSLEATFWNE